MLSLCYHNATTDMILRLNNKTYLSIRGILSQSTIQSKKFIKPYSHHAWIDYIIKTLVVIV